MSITNSPNMNLPVPGVGNEDGPQWAEDLNSCMSILDAHDHSAGNGVRITPSGINISANLPFNGFSATTLLASSYSSQSGALTGTNFVSVVGGNLYFNDGSGNQIPITSGGGVAGSPGSIGSLTAPAAVTYTAGSKLFTFTADSAKSAALDNGAVTIRETNVASAKGITLQSPTSLAADYSLTLPAALPGSSQYLASNSSGVTSFVSADSIATATTATGANAILASSTAWTPATAIANSMAQSRTRTTGVSVGVGGIAMSGDNGVVTTSSSSFVVVTTAITIVTSGRPVQLMLVPNAFNSTGLSGYIYSNSGPASLRIKRDSTEVYYTSLGVDGSGGRNVYLSGSSIATIDAPGAGTYSYQVEIKTNGATSVEVSHCQLMAYEL